jgi:outer membrane protein OmpA-like peptidoglycan-associated protein
MPKIVSPRYYLLFAIIVLLSLVQRNQALYAQRAKKVLKTADAAFKEKDYYQASRLYTVVLYDSPLVKSTPGLVYPHQVVRRRGKLKPAEIVRATYQLAESYRLHNNNGAALLAYKDYLNFRDNKFPLAQLWYAHTLLANNDPIQAQIAYNAFLSGYPKEDEYASMARLGIASCLYTIQELKEYPRATVTKNIVTGSSDGSNFALEKVNDSIVWFTSSRHEMIKKQKSYPVRLYTGNEYSGGVKKMQSGADDQLNMGASSLSADGLTLYFTGWLKNKSSTTEEYQIYYVERSSVSSQWGKPILLPAPVNVKGYSSKQPFITTDGQYLFFSSNQPGTKGSFDIWLVKMDGKTPQGDVINAGVHVNTTREEVSPYFDAGDSSLYFSSDGAIGMGGMDIYKVQGTPFQNNWSKITNLGHPINSGKNDLYYKKYKYSDTVYFSSDRESSCCLEIFNALLLPYIPNKDTASPVIVKQQQAKQDTAQIEPVFIQKDTSRISRPAPDSIEAISVKRMYVNYNFASAKIRSIDVPVLDEAVKQLKDNPELNIAVASFTDCIGSREANINMSKKRSASVRAYLIKKGIDPARINTDYYAKKYFLMACKEDASYDKAAQIANRRSDLILTTDKNPHWTPSGEEIDAASYENKSTVETNVTLSNVQSEASSVNKRVVNRRSKTQKNNNKTTIAEENMHKADTTPQAKQKISEEKASNKTVVQRQRLIPEGQSNVNRSISQQNKLDIGDLLEFVPKVKATNLVDEMKMRIPSKPLFVYTTSDSVRVDLFDNGTFDYDSLSVIYNKEIIVYKQLLRTNKPVTFYVKLSSDQSKNEMIFFAESLGITPPNSALMVITDGENKRTEVNISSDFNFNTVVYFIKVNK